MDLPGINEAEFDLRLPTNEVTLELEGYQPQATGNELTPQKTRHYHAAHHIDCIEVLPTGVLGNGGFFWNRHDRMD